MYGCGGLEEGRKFVLRTISGESNDVKEETVTEWYRKTTGAD